MCPRTIRVGAGPLIATAAPLALPGRASPHGLFLCPPSSALPAGCGTDTTIHRPTPHALYPELPVLGPALRPQIRHFAGSGHRPISGAPHSPLSAPLPRPPSSRRSRCGMMTQNSPRQTLLVHSKKHGEAVMYTTFESPRDHGMPLVTRTPQALKRGRRDLPNRVNRDEVCPGPSSRALWAASMVRMAAMIAGVGVGTSRAARAP
jgi:hypothetical protein